MPNYRFKATDTASKWIAGEIQSATREEAEARLLERGLNVQSLDEAEPIAVFRGPLATSAELVEMAQQLASLTRSGLPLPSGLRAAGLEMTSVSLRNTFFEIADLVESGGKLDEAVGASSKRFPAHLRGLILAGSRSGRLAETLGEYVRAANLASELRRMFLWTLAYPLTAFFTVIALVGFVCSVAMRTVQSLNNIMNDFGVDRPGLTQGVVALARFINDYGFRLVLGGLLFLIFTGLSFRFAMSPARRRRILCAIPVIGPVLRFISMTEFCHLLAMLVEAETPLPEAFELAGVSVRDADMAESCREMGRAVEAGEPLSMAMRRWKSIPAGLGQLFRWSEDRRALPEALHLAGDMFESRARSQAGYAGNVMATFLLLLILWWIGFAVAAIYLPLFSMITLISKLSG